MPLEVISLNAAADKIQHPFSVVPLASVADLSLSLYMCQGQINWHRHPDEDELFLVHEGVVQLDTERGRLTLSGGNEAAHPTGLLRPRCRRPRRHAAEQRDELAPSQMTELHSVPHQPWSDDRITNWRGSVRRNEAILRLVPYRPRSWERSPCS